jgi:hypothetical protein
LPHQPTHLKLNRSFLRNLDTLESFRILCNSRGPCPGFKDAKIAEFQTVVITQLSCDFIKECLDDAFDCHSFCLSPFCNSVDKFLLCNCRHRLPRFRKEQLGNRILFILKLPHNKPILFTYPTAHHTPQSILSIDCGSPGVVFPGRNRFSRPQVQPTKRKFQNFTTYYTTKTSIRQENFK